MYIRFTTVCIHWFTRIFFCVRARLKWLCIASFSMNHDGVIDPLDFFIWNKHILYDSTRGSYVLGKRKQNDVHAYNICFTHSKRDGTIGNCFVQIYNLKIKMYAPEERNMKRIEHVWIYK